MNRHEWFQDRIAQALAGGLPADESPEFEAHRATCPACAGEFDAIQQTEQTMTQLFGAVAPGVDFEDRLLSRLRLRSAVLRIHPFVRRAAVAAAVAIVLGGFGYVGQQQMTGKQLSSTSSLPSLKTVPVFNAKENKANEDKDADPRLSVPAQNAPAQHANDGWEAALNRGQDTRTVNGYAVLYGDDRASFQSNPFSDVQRDIGRTRFNDIVANRKPVTGNDSVTLPRDTDGDVTGSVMHQQIHPKETRSQTESFGVSSPPTGSGNPGRNGETMYRITNGISLNSGKLGESDVSRGIQNNDAPAFKDGRSHNDASSNYYFSPATIQPAESAATNETLTGTAGESTAAVHMLDKPGITPSQPTDTLADQREEKTKPAAQPAAQDAGASVEPQRTPTTQDLVRKVIRNGDIEFEVDSFDSSTVTITKIALEEQGYIATTNSEKLPNGKVKGAVVVRVPPEHLDTLVLKLRALGDLKSQNLTAQDVTKQYTDTASELRAAHAMEDRLLEIIKNSQGAIKDLLAAEKELAVWREKIEKLEGSIRYYDNLVSLSTLNISLFERDIKKADVLKETENVDMGVEADDVEAQRAAAIKAIDQAKGRIVESELRKLDAGQLAARVVADIPPDASGPAIDRLKQLGKVARLEIHRAQKSANDQPASPGAKLERGDTHLVLSLYNLANVAPRQTHNLNLAAVDVEQAYNAILEKIAQSDGRVVTSNLNRQTDQQTSGVIQFEVKTANAEAMLNDVRKTGEVTRLTVAENADTNNVTTAKRGVNVQIVSLASLLPREVNNRSIASADVDKSYQSIIASLRQSNARIVVSRIEDAGQGQHTGYIDFEIPRTQQDAIEKALSDSGETYNRSVNAAADADNVTDSKVQFKLSVSPASALAPRENNALAVEVSDVDKAAERFQSGAIANGGRVIDSNFSKDQRGQTARLVVEVPYSNANQIVAQAKQLGAVRGSQQSTNQQSPSGELARARIELTLASGDVLVTPEHGVMATLRTGLATSFAGLMWSLQLIVIGLCLVAPWVVLIGLFVKLIRRWKRTRAVSVS